MSSTFGKIIELSLFGESHGPCVGLVVNGLPSGIKIPYQRIKEELNRRKSHFNFETSRVEEEDVEFLSGIKEGYTTGSPLTIIIPNKNINSKHYEKGVIRPSHADYAAYIKYSGFNAYEGGGHFSGRLTAPLVALGAILKQELEKENIVIRSHIKSIGGIEDVSLKDKPFDLINNLKNESFAVTNNEIKEKMLLKLQEVSNEGDSIGGSVETIVCNLPIGIGEPFFDSLESIISHLLFSIGGVKGVLFGDGLDFKTKKGSELNDEVRYEDDKVKFLSNHSGGIQGGISNGERIVFETIIKPVSSIKKLQKSINLETKENIDLEINGRHDACIVSRVLPVIEAITSYALYELMMLNLLKRGK